MVQPKASAVSAWIGGGETVLRSNVGKADQSVHDCQLPGMIELESGDTFAIGQDCRLGELVQLSAIDERFEDVLLDVVIPVDDARHFFAQSGQIVDGFANSVLGDVVGRGLGSEIGFVSDVLLDEAILVVAAMTGLGKSKSSMTVWSLPAWY